jgi:hypothetical protein
VSAIISAFHGGSDLLKHIKQKRRKARAQAQQDYEEKQLQNSLDSGELQIGLRYTQDIRELGDYVRIGDGKYLLDHCAYIRLTTCPCAATARDRLLHIAITIQAEIIKSLQMAAKHETAILNLRILHEASIMNRKDTFTVLDELKQRIIMTRPLARQTEAKQDAPRQRVSIASAQTTQLAGFDPAAAIPPDYMPKAVQISTQAPEETKETRQGLARYFSIKRNSGTSVKSSSSQSSIPADCVNIDFSAALEQYARAKGSEDRAVIMEEIDDITASYRDLNLVDSDPKEPRSPSQAGSGAGGRRDTLDILNAESIHGQNNTNHTWNHPAGSFSDEQRGHRTSATPAFKNVFSPPPDPYSYRQQYPVTSPPPNISTHPLQPQWSNTSATSSNHSGMSHDRNNSNSSQDASLISPVSSDCSLPPDHESYSFLSQKYQQHGSDSQAACPTPSGLSVSVEYVPPIAPLSTPQSTSQPDAKHYSLTKVPSLPNAPNNPYGAVDQNAQAPYVGAPQLLNTSRVTSNAPLQYVVTSGTEADNPPALSAQVLPAAEHQILNTNINTSELTILQPAFITTTAQTLAPLSAAGPRNYSIANSVSSTDSTGSGSVGVLPRLRGSARSASIQSPPPGQERMMEGRPCKDNNYWGFCKGAWGVREDVKKGLSLRTQPSGMYSTREVWECQHCDFWGKTFSAPHPTRRNKRDTIVDPNIHTSNSGVRYRWTFLAKSHARCKSTDVSAGDCNYGCMICSAEGNVTGIYGNVDTLMYHILEHVADMSSQTMFKTKCVVGRTASANEEWDINVPLFADAG